MMTNVPDILATAYRLNGVRGPYEIDGYTYVTDLCGFIALRGIGLSPNSKPAKEQDIAMARSLIEKTASKAFLVSPLKDFLRERLEREDPAGCVECSVFGCVVDARIVKKWLDVIAADECRIAAQCARTRQKEQGESLLFEGDDWKLVIAGLIPSLKFPPTYDAAEIELAVKV